MTRFGPALIVLLLPLALSADDKPPAAFKSEGGKFSVAFPDKPTEKTNKVKLGDTEVEMHMFVVAQKDRVFLTSYNEYPKAAIGGGGEKVLAEVVEANVKKLNGKLATDEKITLGKKKYPGRIIRIEMPEKKWVYRARIFLVGDRLYQVVALGPDEFAKSKMVDGYLNSFEIDE